MNLMKKVLLAVAVVLLASVPALASTTVYFTTTEAGTTTAEVDVRSSIAPSFRGGTSQMLITYIAASSDLVGANLTIKGFTPDCVSTTLASATAAAQAVLTLASTAGVTAGDYLFLQDIADVNDYESVIISAVSTLELNVVTLTTNLVSAYPTYSTVFQIKNVADLEPFVSSVSSEATYPNSTFSVPAGSPISVRLDGTSACKLTISGTYQK